MKKLLLLLTVSALISCKNENKTVEIQNSTDTAGIEQTETTDSDQLGFAADKTALKWTAYKTPEKVAVHGSFDSIVVNNTKESVIPEEILENADFTIYTSSMTTGDVSRDAKIIGLFFNNLEGQTITGSFGKFSDNTVPVTLKMNNVEAVKDFSYTFENKKIIITGVIDVIEDFKAQKGFDLLEEACAALHMNKSWTDVSIEVISDLER